MSKELLEYKGYHGSAEISVEDNVLYGSILFINDLVTYEADTPDGLRAEFEAAVDDYLETCRELGKEPDKEFKGSFNVRVGPELHRLAALEASCEGISLNDFVRRAVTQATRKPEEVIHRHVHEHQVTVPIEDFSERESWPIKGNLSRNIS